VGHRDLGAHGTLNASQLLEEPRCVWEKYPWAAVTTNDGQLNDEFAVEASFLEQIHLVVLLAVCESFGHPSLRRTSCAF